MATAPAGTPGGVGYVDPFAATAQPNNGSSAPTVPAPVSTTAPTGTTSTSTPPATPTAVVSSNTAANQVNNVIKPAMQQGQTAIATQAANSQQTTLAQDQAKQANAGKPGYDVFGNPVVQPPTPLTPEQQLASQPDAGHQFVYDAQGNQSQVPVGQVPPGYSTTNPHIGPTTPVADQTTDPAGNVYKQFTDGTYGKYSVTGTYIGPATQNDFQQSKNGESAINSLNQLANGTFPLSANEQAQVDGIKAQFAALITAQQTANANFTGGTTVAENIYGMGNSLTGLGEIKGTIDAGIAKIADLNSKMGAAIASMEDGFRTNDIAAIKAAYDVYSTSVKDRQTELDTAQAAISKALVDAQTAQRENETLALTKMMDDNTISYQVKQQALAQSTLDEKTKDDIATQQLDKLKYNLDVEKEGFAESQALKASQGTGIGDTLPVATMTSAGVPDPAIQTQLLNSLPGGPTGDLATQVKGLANYTLNPTDFTVRTLKGGTQITRDQMVALVQKYDPSYDDKQYQTRQNFLKSLNGGGVLNQKVIALNTASSHLATVAASISKLGNVNFNPFGLTNGIKNAVGGSIGTIPTSGAKLAVGAVTGELATAFKQAGATDAEIKSLGTIDQNSSPASVQSYITNATDLMAGKIQAITDSYTSTMGKSPDASLMSPTAQSALSTLKNEGYQIDIPGIQYTDRDAYIKGDPNAQANMTTAISQLQVAGLPLTPENIMQLAQSQ